MFIARKGKDGYITDKIVYLGGISTYVIVLIGGIFITPCNFKVFFNYIEYISKIDVIIFTQYTKSDKYLPILMVCLLILLENACTKLEIYLIYSAYKDEMRLTDILGQYEGFDLSVLVSLIIEYTNGYLGQSIEKRIKRLNDLIKEQFCDFSEGRRKQSFMRNPLEKEEEEAIIIDPFPPGRVKSIITLKRVYLDLSDALGSLNKLLNITTLLEVLSIYLQLIEGIYLFIVPLTTKAVNLATMTPKCLLLIIHFTRILLITEPWYSCIQRIESTKGHVCKLLSVNINVSYRKEVRDFALILGLRQFQFSACGMFRIDRFLFTSLIGNISTILVILLQYKHERGS